METTAERRTLTAQAARGRASGTTWAGRATSGLRDARLRALVPLRTRASG